MKYSIHNVCLATTLRYTEIKLSTPDQYTDSQWEAIADVIETLIDVSETAEEENKKEEEEVPNRMGWFN